MKIIIKLITVIVLFTEEFIRYILINNKLFFPIFCMHDSEEILISFANKYSSYLYFGSLQY